MAVLLSSPAHVSFLFCRLLVLCSCGVTFLGSLVQGQDYGNPDDVTFRWLPISDTTGGGGGVGERRRVRVYGTVSNFTAGDFLNTSYATFYGIPFALAPTSHLRFTRPTLRYLDKDFRANVPPLGCPQLAGGGGGMIGSEDCLQLNVYVPTEPGSGSMPVLVWIHGDSPDRLATAKVLAPLTSGKAMNIDPSFFMPGRMVVVVPQYRLGTLGFASTVNEDISGNTGLFDILLSLEWVTKFISHFSGDSSQVTLLGGSLVGLLATTELGRGFFQRVILMGGGSPISPLIAVDPTPKVTYGEVALQNGCPSFPSSHFVRCMQARRVGSIVEADARLAKGRGGGLARARLPLPVIEKDADGRFLPPLLFRTPTTSLAEGSFHHVPIMVGVTGAEMKGFLTGIAGAESPDDVKVFSSSEVLQNFVRSLLIRGGGGAIDPDAASTLLAFEYFAGLNITERREQAWDILEELLGDMLFTMPALSMAKMWSKHAPVYFYLFDHGDSASHGSDVAFLLNGHTSPSGTDRDLAAIMTSLWTSFIHQGTPLNAGIPWPEWRDTSGRQVLLLSGDEVAAERGPRERQFHLWNTLLPAITMSSNKCPKTSASYLSSASQLKNSRGKTSLIFKDVDETEVGKMFYTMQQQPQVARDDI